MITSAENGDEERQSSRRSARAMIWASNSFSNFCLNSRIFFFQPKTCIHSTRLRSTSNWLNCTSYKLPCYSKHSLYLDWSWVDSQASHLEEEVWWQGSLFLTVLFMLPSKPSTAPSNNINFLYMYRKIFLPMVVAVWLNYNLSSILYFILMHWTENHEAVSIFIDYRSKLSILQHLHGLPSSS